MIHLQKYRIWIVGSLSVLLLSCSGAVDELPGGALPEGKYPLLIDGITLDPVETASRAVETEAGTTWEAGDKIHLWVKQGAEVMTTECTLDAAGNVTAYSPQLYWKSPQTAEIKAWYMAGSSIDAAGNGRISLGDLRSRPLLTASATASWLSGKIRLHFSHATAKVTVKVTGASAAKVKTIGIRGLYYAQMTGGVLTPASEPTVVFIYMTKLSDTPAAEGPVFTIGLFPNGHLTGSNITECKTLKINSTDVYVNDLPALEAGKHYTINLTVDARPTDAPVPTADDPMPVKAVLVKTATLTE